MIRVSDDREIAVIPLDSTNPVLFRDNARPRLIFVSSGFRIDNRRDLAAQLGIPANADNDTLLVSAWERWGTDVPDRLRGAFAFALLLPQSRAIFVARDIFGLCPIYYAFEGGELILASSSQAVRALLPSPATPNELMLADFISGETLETEQTFFEQIRRLPPAHYLFASLRGVEVTRYWSMADVPRDKSPPDAARTFRRLFDNAVEVCSADVEPTLLISGGLDSSAIAASMAACGSQPVRHAAAMTFPETPDWHDGPYLDEITRTASLETLEFPSEGHSPLADVERWLEATDGPHIPPGWSISFRLTPMLKERGFDTILSGHGGDEIVSYGFGRLNELARRGRWLAFWKEASAAANMFKDGTGSRRYVVRNYMAHLWPVKLWRNLKPKLRQQDKTANAETTPALLSERLDKKIGRARYQIRKGLTRRDHDERFLHEEAMSLALQPQSLEIFAACAKACGVEYRFPFYDRDLFEFSLSLSSDWKLRDGLSRYVLRAAMGEDFPPAIRKRVDKYDFGTHFMDGLIGARQTVMELTDPAHEQFADFLNLDKLHTLRKQMAEAPDDLERLDAMYLWRVAVLRLWLQMADRLIPRPELRDLTKE